MINPLNSFNTNWIKPVEKAVWNQNIPSAMNINVDGRKITSPIRGFGQMWLRTYRIALPAISHTPEEVMALWKEKFSSFWQTGNSIYFTGGDIQPGETCLINLTLPGGIRLVTGAVVIYADSTSFALATVQGHMFAGWIVFSCYQEGDVFAQTQALVRPGDLFYELSFRLGIGTAAEDRFWHQTLRNLAKYFHVENTVQQTNLLVDSHIQWQYFPDLWYNAGIRSGVYLVTSPLRWLVNKFRKS